jgi:hypothetical protein
MTFAGKLFVLVNAGMSLFWLVAAFALFATGMEWAYDPGKPAQTAPGGILKEKQDEIARQGSMQFHVEQGWRKAYVDLRKREEDRRGFRKFYAAEFAHNEKNASEVSPARIVRLRDGFEKDTVRDSVATLDPKTRLPQMVEAKDQAGKGLQAAGLYDKDLDAKRAENKDLLDKLEAEVKKDIAYTEQMIDTARGKGLRTLLVEERFKRNGIIDEQRQVRPLFINTAVESELILKRLESLEERIKELERYMKKRKMDVKLSRR